MRGFSLLEAVLAIGILSVVLAQTISIQANTIAASQSALNNMKATWALRQGAAQLEYVLDVYGAKEGLKQEQKFPWGADPEFNISVKPLEVPIEASRLLVSAMKMGSSMSEGAAEGSDDSGDNEADSMKEYASFLDAMIPKDIFKQLTIEVSWKQGELARNLDSGFFLMDAKDIKIPSIPSMEK